MNKQFQIIFGIILFTTISFGQAQDLMLSGYVLDEKKTGVPYANIGILNTTIGTISDENGFFEIMIPWQYESKSILFTAIGYKTKNLDIKEIEYPENIEIELSVIKEELAIVNVSAKKSRNRKFKIGNNYAQGGVNLCSDPEFTNGASVAILIEGEKHGGRNFEYPVFLNTAKLKIHENTLDNYKIRLRAYSIEPKTGLPGKEILTDNIIMDFDKFSGWVKFDLSEYEIIVEEDFFIAFEWILDKQTRKEISKAYKKFELLNPDKNKTKISAIDGQALKTKIYDDFNVGTSYGVCMTENALNDYKTFVRYNSFGKWQRAGFILAAEVILNNQKD